MTGAILNREPGKNSLKVTFEQRLEISLFLVTRVPIFFSNSIAHRFPLSSVLCLLSVVLCFGCPEMCYNAESITLRQAKCLICSPVTKI